MRKQSKLAETAAAQTAEHTRTAGAHGPVSPGETADRDAADRDAAASASERIWESQLVTEASQDKLDAVQAFVDECMERLNPSAQVRMHVALAVEEIFINIANYAYASGAPGEAAIRCEADSGTGRLTVVFADGGVPYNPLERPDPDVDLPMEERPIGGLGIFMTKRLMDAVRYRYEDGKNILTVVKNMDSGIKPE
jgi:anti-sigma regulatory factor (Ser/Thr protein kinase)